MDNLRDVPVFENMLEHRGVVDGEYLEADRLCAKVDREDTLKEGLRIVRTQRLQFARDLTPGAAVAHLLRPAQIDAAGIEYLAATVDVGMVPQQVYEIAGTSPLLADNCKTHRHSP